TWLSGLGGCWLVLFLSLWGGRFRWGQTACNFLAEPSDGLIQMLNLREVLSQQEAMMSGYLSSQRALKGLPVRTNSPCHKSGQAHGVGVSVHHGAQDHLSRFAHHVGDHIS